ncbi:hypothetical protein ADK59_06480 [Streptomyces sp. XY332]|nr:hypothetical protein ADK59_06480 [Streptomyces sp. XY332]
MPALTRTAAPATSACANRPSPGTPCARRTASGGRHAAPRDPLATHPAAMPTGAHLGRDMPPPGASRRRDAGATSWSDATAPGPAPPSHGLSPRPSERRSHLAADRPRPQDPIPPSSGCPTPGPPRPAGACEAGGPPGRPGPPGPPPARR